MYDAIRDAGLACDGATDDTARLRAFLAAHPGPLVIQWPQCVCCIGNLAIDRSHVKLAGAGAGTPFGPAPHSFTTFLYPASAPAGAGTFVLKLAGPVAGCEMDGIAIDARGADIGLWLHTASFCRFPSISVAGAAGWAMILDVEADNAISGKDCRDNFFGHLQLEGNNGLRLSGDPCSNYFQRADILYNGAMGTRGILFEYCDSNHFDMVNVGACSPTTEPGVEFRDAWQNHINWLVSSPGGVTWKKGMNAEWGNSIGALATGDQKGAAIECGLSIMACNGQTWNVGQPVAVTGPPARMPTAAPAVQIVTPPAVALPPRAYTTLCEAVAPEAGTNDIGGSVGFTRNPAGESDPQQWQRYARVVRGDEVLGYATCVALCGDNTMLPVAIPRPVQLAAGDRIEWQAYHTGEGAVGTIPGAATTYGCLSLRA